MTDLRSQRRMLLLLVAMFFLPIAVSFVLYYATSWRPGSSSNHGELYSPARPLPETLAPPKGKWALLYVGDGQCDANCQRALVFGRQTRLSLNKEMTRVNRMLVATANCCNTAYLSKEHAGLLSLDLGNAANAGDAAPGSAASAFLALIPPADREHSLYVVDPHGNLVMRFDTRESPRGLLTDLNKLLKLSHIG